MTDQPQDRSVMRRLKRLVMRGLHGMLTCREMDDFLVDYFSDTLSAAARTRFELHLKTCPNCREYVRGYGKTLEMTRRVFEEDEAEVPPEVPEPLVAAILDARRRNP